jgi:hypothetical protein
LREKSSLRPIATACAVSRAIGISTVRCRSIRRTSIVSRPAAIVESSA